MDASGRISARVAVACIALAEFLGTSLWFTANGVAVALEQELAIDVVAIGWLTSAVQIGFICGTLIVALTGIADRFSASRIFFAAALAGALANVAFAFSGSLNAMLAWRFFTGFTLAGIYPLGMKLVVGWSPGRAGQALGWLVGMLVLGTALPHLVQALAWQPDWRAAVVTASVLAVLGGVVVLIVGDGPSPPPAARLNWGGVLRAFRTPAFRSAAFGYFGHMWELYALWAIAPFLVAHLFPGASPAVVSSAAFLFIAAGAIGCIAGGRISYRTGSAPVAFVALFVSGALCLFGPLLLAVAPTPLVLLLMLTWGIAVVADSPQFSALVAKSAPADTVGSGLAIVNGIGFLITVGSISLLAPAWQAQGLYALWLLAPGPIIGLAFLFPLAWKKAGARWPSTPQR